MRLRRLTTHEPAETREKPELDVRGADWRLCHYEASNAVREDRDVEIDEQSLLDRKKLLDRLYFEHHLVLYDKVRLVISIQYFTLEWNLDSRLSGES